MFQKKNTCQQKKTLKEIFFTPWMLHKHKCPTTPQNIYMYQNKAERSKKGKKTLPHSYWKWIATWLLNIMGHKALSNIVSIHKSLANMLIKWPSFCWAYFPITKRLLLHSRTLLLVEKLLLTLSIHVHVLGNKLYTAMYKYPCILSIML